MASKVISEYPFTIRSRCCLAPVTVWEVERTPNDPYEEPYTENEASCDWCGETMEWNEEIQSDGDVKQVPDNIFDLTTRRDVEKLCEFHRCTVKEAEESLKVVEPLKALQAALTKYGEQE